ncbi:hypothetical protein [Pseudopedobacter beijingensis]|uniref:Uncharacterized protein n=1 Tax=Pseudopedobacter beijingensis TaxID=1207056 RepID=A0ABW4IGE0_9SPHI
MIDTIIIKIASEKLPENYNELLDEMLINKEKSYKESRGEVLRGNYKNFHIKLNRSGLLIAGSLTNYTLGTNLKTAFKEQLKEAICKLGKELALDLLKDGRVLRLDIATNIITKLPVEEYYKTFENLARTNRLEQPNGLLFKNTNRSVLFYGKIAQLRKDKIPIESIMKDKNVLRYEYRFSNHSALCRFLKIEEVNVQSVFQHYTKIIDNWLKNFLAITKTNKVKRFNKDTFLIRGIFIKQLQRLGLESLGGAKSVLEMIDNAKREGAFRKYPNEISNIRKKVKSLLENPSLIDVVEVGKELQRKIEMLHFYVIAIDEKPSFNP